MAFTIDRVVPWGRPLGEYQRMFALSSADLAVRILGCGDGPASFNAELTAAGGSVVSVDPLYRCSADDIRDCIEETFDVVVEQTRRNHDEFMWGRVITDIDDLARVRRTAMRRFLADYDQGLADGRYVAGALPALPFDDGAFDLAVCSHLLFLYSKHLPLEFHIASLTELCRVADEVRVFPLLELGSRPSRHLHDVVDALRHASIEAAIEPVDYEFQRGGNQMLRLGSPAIATLS